MQSVMQMFVARSASRNLSISRMLVLRKNPKQHASNFSPSLCFEGAGLQPPRTRCLSCQKIYPLEYLQPIAPTRLIAVLCNPGAPASI